MIFGEYLVDRGVIDADEFYEAFKVQLASRPQLGFLAVKKRLLTIHQVFAVLHEQCDAPSELFGDLAVRLGFITLEDVNQLLREQSELMTPFSDVLADLGILDRETSERLLVEFKAAMEQSMHGEMVMAPA